MIIRVVLENLVLHSMLFGLDNFFSTFLLNVILNVDDMQCSYQNSRDTG